AGGLANAIANDPSASGQLTVHDVDTGEDHFATPASLAGTYRKFTRLNTTHPTTSTPDHSLTEHLTAGQHVTDTLTVASFDGTATYPIFFIFSGHTDPAAISALALHDALPI